MIYIYDNVRSQFSMGLEIQYIIQKSEPCQHQHQHQGEQNSSIILQIVKLKMRAISDKKTFHFLYFFTAFHVLIHSISQPMNI